MRFSPQIIGSFQFLAEGTNTCRSRGLVQPQQEAEICGEEDVGRTPLNEIALKVLSPAVHLHCNVEIYMGRSQHCRAKAWTVIYVLL